MAKFHISDVMVIEGDIYDIMGEDEMLYVYDLQLQAIVDGDIYIHHHVFKGHCQDDDGFDHPNRNAKSDAEDLCAKVADRGIIDTAHWDCIGNVSELPDPLEALKTAFADNSDYYE